MTAPSVEDRALSAVTVILCLVVGLIFASACGYFLFLEMKEPGPPHTTHIVLFLGGMLIGVLIALPKQVFPIIQKIIVIVAPYVPVIGGRRAGDPSATDSGSPSASNFPATPDQSRGHDADR